MSYVSTISRISLSVSTPTRMWAKCAAEGCFSTNYDALKAAHACRGAASWTIFICHRTPKRCWIAPTLRRSNALFSRMLHVASPLLTHTHTERGRGGSRNQNQRLECTAAQTHISACCEYRAQNSSSWFNCSFETILILCDFTSKCLWRTSVSALHLHAESVFR